MATIPLDEIIPGATIRFAVIDGVQYLSIRDLIMHMCGKNPKRASEVWENISQEQKQEVSEKIGNFKFPGQGQSTQPVITFPGAIQLSMFLPGENAKKNRSVMSKILVRYFAGDPSLIQEIEANGVSDAPVAQMARASLANELGPDALESKKRQRELDSLSFMERQTAITERIMSIRERQIGMVKTAKETMDLVMPDWAKDGRLKLQMEDWTKNAIFNQGGLTITNGEPAPLQSISISQVAKELGYRARPADLIAIGKAVAQAYREEQGEDPPKHRQWVDGAERDVNSYTERDRVLIADKIRERMDT